MPRTPRPRRFAAAALAALVLLAPAAARAGARPPDPLDAAHVRLSLERLRSTASVLYVGAHPDDENTAMLAWLASARHARTAYLSLTRGDGGQNLVGAELGAELGVIRTQELLAARRTDGAEQLFTRAVDFGYSKNPEETFATWNRDSVLEDVVRVVRRFRPDVIVTRFPTDGRGGHGHHTASAILSEEAFAAAADPARFPGCGPAWRTRRLVWNAFVPDTSKVDSTWLRIDVGRYDPLIGRSYGEIAAASRSHHASQGFGVPERHGAMPQWLAPRLGEPMGRDLLDGVTGSWRRFAGGERIDTLLARAVREFDDAHPAASLPRLAEIARAMDALREREPVIAALRAELADVIRSCAGLWIEAVASRANVVPGETLAVAIAVHARGAAANVSEVALGEVRDAAPHALAPGAVLAETLRVVVPAAAEPTQPYWLRASAGRGLFAVADRALVGEPEGPPAFAARVVLETGGAPLSLALPVAYRWADPVLGERWRAVVIAPPASLDFEHGVLAFPDATPREVNVTARAIGASVRGRLALELPAGWTCAPAAADVALAKPGDETRVRFVVTPGAGPARASIGARLVVNGRTWSRHRVEIDHPHIPPQTLFFPASVPAVRAEIAVRGTRAGYVAGSGDAAPDALHQLGFDVSTLTDEQLASADLSRFDVIVIGVRAFNTRPRLVALKERLVAYANAGGRVLVQYQNLGEGVRGDLGPHPFALSTDRVTDERAEVRALDPASPVLNAPNRIEAADWDGWVQERGLQFARVWDAHWSAPLSSHDPGEPARDGGLLVAPVGRGS